MTRVVVIGGSGYAGGHIVEAAEVRGLEVVSMARSETAEQMRGVRYVRGDVLTAADRVAAMKGADVVLVAVSPRGNMVGRVREAVAAIAADAAEQGIRLGVVGGAGSLQVEGGGLLMDTAGFPDAVKPEAREMTDVLEDLRVTPEALDWFMICPGASFGPEHAGEYTGDYRIGGDDLLVDDEGNSNISGADFGMAVVDEIEAPDHRRTRFTVAY